MIIGFLFLVIMMLIFLLTIKNNLTIAISSLIIGIVCLLLIIIKEPLALSFSLLTWVTLIVLKNDEKWINKLQNFLIFIIIGIVSSISLYYLKDLQILILILFFFITKLLDMI